jgi:hypothetical protein
VPSRAKELGIKTKDAKDQGLKEPEGSGWRLMGTTSELFEKKEIKAVQVGSITVCLYRHGGQIYAR